MVNPIEANNFAALFNCTGERLQTLRRLRFRFMEGPFSAAITSLGEESDNFSAFRTFVRFVLVWICRFPLPLGVCDGLRFMIVAFPGLFS